MGHYELWIDGVRVGDRVLDPGWTHYKKTCLYSTFDVTDQIHGGTHCLAVMLGNGMFHERGKRYWKFIGSFGSPQMILNLRIEFADGSTSTIVSDDAWKLSLGPIFFSSIFGGEDYDARLDQPGWDRPGFDDSDWKAASIVTEPGGKLVAQSAPPIKIHQAFKPISVTEPSPLVFLYDLGQNFSGWPKLSLRGPAGAEVRITPAEVLDERGLADQKGSGAPCYFTYILKGEGIETWHPQFTYYGFRYLQIEGAVPLSRAVDHVPVVVEVEGLFTRGSARRAGNFACSKTLFNRIHEMIDWSIGSNLQSVVTDCPHREKLGWLEIGNLMAPSIMYSYDIASLFSKIVRGIGESQLDNGMVPTIIPEYVTFSDGFRDSPSAAAVQLAWYLYRWYGDRRILEESYPMMKRYVDYLTGKARNHIVAYGLGDWGDFPSVEEHLGWAQLTPIALTGTAIYYFDTTVLARAATVLDIPEDTGMYTSLAHDIRDAFNRAFFNSQENKYASGTPAVANEVRNEFNHCLFDQVTDRYAGGSQTSQAMPLDLGLVERERDGKVLNHLVEDVEKHGYVTAGDMGHPFLLRALAERGRSDVVYALHGRTDLPGYGWQVEQGCTTLTETRDARPRASMNHCTFGNITEWFYAHLLGIQFAEDCVGFRRIVIRPQVVGDLGWARGDYDSVRGRISVDWQVEDGRLSLKVAIPPNTSATIFVPTHDSAQVLESGVPAGDAEGVTFVRSDKDCTVFMVGSGIYDFEA